MKFGEFFFVQAFNAFFPWPALSICQAECPCCGEPAPVWSVELAFICWHVGFTIETGTPDHPPSS